jgi:FkbM family methyltransferase
VQPAPLARLRASLPRDEVQVFECLLGAKSDEHVTLHLAETASSVLVEKASPQQAQAHFPMRTIDEVIETELAGRSPDFLKLDVQGYELEVLTGAKEHLRDVQLVLAEVNLLDIHAEVPLLHELVAWFAARQWVAFDICGLTRRPLDKALWQADFLFVPEDSALRLDKRWKS